MENSYEIERFNGWEYVALFMSEDYDDILDEFNRRITDGEKQLRLIHILKEGPYEDELEEK